MYRMAAVVLLLVASAPGHAQKPGPRPTPLWQFKPFDRVTLTNGASHDIDPQRIPPGVKFDLEEGEYVGRPGLPPVREIRRTLRYRIHLQVNGLDYYVFGRNVRQIELYEDLLLRDARRLIGEGRLDEALPYLERIQEIHPDWPGLAEARIDFHREESRRSELSGNFDRAFWSLVEAKTEHETLRPEIKVDPPWNDEIDRIADRWIQANVLSRNFREARRVIGRLESVRPQSPIVAKWRDDLARQVAALVEESRELHSRGLSMDALDRIEQAAGIDPSDTGVRAAVEAAYRDHGHLRIAVEQLASLSGPLARTEADSRVFELVHLSLVKPVFGSDPPRWFSPVLTSVQRPDSFVNRRAILEVRPGLKWPLDNKSVSITDIQRILVEACRMGSETYHPAFARLVTQIEPQPPNRLAIDFDRPQPRPEAWLDVPVARRIETAERHWVGLGPFVTFRSTRDSMELRANPCFWQPDRPILGKVTEMRIPIAAERLQALDENRVDVVTNLLPRQVKAAGKIAGVTVVPLRVPVVHVLQFNWNQRALRERTLRRAIAMAIDRVAILEKLGLDSADPNVLPTAPWPIGTFGYDPTIEPRPFDPILAKTLIAAVRRKHSSLPVLRLLHGGTQADQLVCDEVARFLKAAGLETATVALDPSSQTNRSTADLYYVGLRIAEPVQDMVTVLTRDSPSLWDHASPWLRQAVVNLVEVPTITEARLLLPRLHRAIHDDVACLPIWQEVEHIAVSNRVSGLAERQTSIYDGVVDWRVRPGFGRPDWQVSMGSEENK